MHVCPNCSIEFIGNTKYCSLSCRSIYNNNRRNKNTINKISKSVRKTFKNKFDAIQKSYTISPSKCMRCAIPLPFEKRFNKYCGKSCSNSSRIISKSHKEKTAKTIINNAKEKYNRNPKYCKICKTLLPYEKKKRSTCCSMCFKSLRKEDRKSVV